MQNTLKLCLYAYSHPACTKHNTYITCYELPALPAPPTTLVTNNCLHYQPRPPPHLLRTTVCTTSPAHHHTCYELSALPAPPTTTLVTNCLHYQPRPPQHLLQTVCTTSPAHHNTYVTCYELSALPAPPTKTRNLL